MTAPDPGQNPQDGQDSKDTGTADSELTLEAAVAELKRARGDAVKYRQRAKEFADDEAYKRAKEAVAALDKVEQDKKTEVQKLTEDKEGLLHRAATAETGLQRLRVALDHVPSDRADEFASRLRGDTEDDLKRDAEQLARFFQSSSTPTRRSDPSQGRGSSDGQSTVDPLQAALEDKLRSG